MLKSRLALAAVATGSILGFGVLTAAPAMADTYAQASVPGCWAQVDRSGVKTRIILGATTSDSCTGIFYVYTYYLDSPNQTFTGPWTAWAGNPRESVTVCNDNTGRCATSAAI